MTKPIGVIGAGFSGLAAAITLASRGEKVHVYEKHSQAGGRARKFSVEGFTFDMGPSWYWMPDIFSDFFKKFDKNVEDYYKLIRLDPSYRVIHKKGEFVDLPADLNEIYKLFDQIDPGSAERLKNFLKDAEIKYKEATDKFIWKPSLSALEFADPKFIKSAFKLHLFSSISSRVQKITNDPLLKQILEFPVLFLGAKPEDTPALYSMMNYADMCLGTWYPEGGMYKIVEALEALAIELGVQFFYDTDVRGFDIENKRIRGINTTYQKFEVDSVIASADYAFVDRILLPKQFRNYSENYWASRKMAPSALIYYVGTKRRIPNLEHHNLFFDSSFEKHSSEIYDHPAWPSNPLFYVCVPSKTDPSVAPPDKENMFVLVPLAAGLDGDNENIRMSYLNTISKRIKRISGIDIKQEIQFIKTYSVSNFKQDYNAFKGNAYGMANTLDQTAFLKPRIQNRFIKNLLFTGQLSVPGPGVPPSLISGQVVAEYLLKTKERTYV